MSALQLCSEPLDPGRAAALVADPAHGGTAMFIGSTRAEGEGPHAVVALEYDAYEEMAHEVAGTLAREVAARYGVRLAVMHRLGVVPAGEASLVIAASAPHRAAAFAACRFALEAIKRDLPVWKREIRANGRGAWRDGMDGAVASSA